MAQRQLPQRVPKDWRFFAGQTGISDPQGRRKRTTALRRVGDEESARNDDDDGGNGNGGCSGWSHDGRHNVADQFGSFPASNGSDYPLGGPVTTSSTATTAAVLFH